MKVIIVEDEPRVRKGLSEAVEWSELGMTLIGTASNGQEGLELFYSSMPNLIITDIRMPVMDGLEMTKIILEHAPSTKIIIISGHDEFEYAQRCVALGVNNYLLKPIGQKEFAQELQALRQVWLSEKHMQEQEIKFQQTLRSHMQQLRSVFLEEWLGGVGYRSEHELLDNFSVLAIKLEPSLPTAIAIFEVDEADDPSHITFDRSLLEYAMHNLLDELVTNVGITYQRGNGQTVVIFQPTSFHYDNFTSWINDAKSKAEVLLAVEITVGIGSRAVNIVELPLIFQETQRILALKLSLGSGVILEESMIHPVSEQLPVLHESFEALLIHSVEINDIEEISRVIEQHFLKWKDNKELAFKEEIFFQFTGLFSKLVHRLGHSIRDFLDADQLKKWQQPDLFRSLGDMQAWWIARFTQLSECYQGFRTDRKTQIIQQVMQYVDDHIDENISREDAANHIFLNASYLSRLFKEVRGESFSNYVLNKKMERAIHLLNVERIMVYEVAERLGYKDPSYFARVFKKHVGKSPSDFQ